jgi:hypothetical protein
LILISPHASRTAGGNSLQERIPQAKRAVSTANSASGSTAPEVGLAFGFDFHEDISGAVVELGPPSRMLT